jgi:small subunit ribosomal protein S17
MTDKKEVKNIDTKIEAIRKKFEGIVVSDKMDKTIVVKVDRVKQHPKYLKRYTVSKRYKVHDEKNQYKEGDKVSFIECRPLSKNKMWRIIN